MNGAERGREGGKRGEEAWARERRDFAMIPLREDYYFFFTDFFLLHISLGREGEGEEGRGGTLWTRWTCHCHSSKKRDQERRRERQRVCVHSERRKEEKEKRKRKNRNSGKPRCLDGWRISTGGGKIRRERKNRKARALCYDSSFPNVYNSQVPSRCIGVGTGTGRGRGISISKRDNEDTH